MEQFCTLQLFCVQLLLIGSYYLPKQLIYMQSVPFKK